MEMNIRLKIVVLGKQKAGKTSFIENFILGKKNLHYNRTESYQLSIYQFNHKSQMYEIQFWDCGAQHLQYNKPTRNAFFNHASAAFIIFDLLDSNWQKDIQLWVQQAYRFECYLIYAIGTKKDLLFRNLNSDDQNLKYGLRKSLISGRESIIGKKEDPFEQIQFALNTYFSDIDIKHFYQAATQSISSEVKNIFVHIYDDRQKVTRQSIARAIRFDNSEYDEFLKLACKEYYNNPSIIQQQFQDKQESQRNFQ